jgi:hypothetical protein
MIMEKKCNNKSWLRKICGPCIFAIILMSCTLTSFSQDCGKKLGALPSIVFKSKSIAITPDGKLSLSVLAKKLQAAPECRIVVTGYCSSNKKDQQRSWDRVNVVINTLVDKEGISSDRFIFVYGEEGGDCNTVDIRPTSAGEEGPSTVAPPHPNLRPKTTNPPPKKNNR